MKTEKLTQLLVKLGLVKKSEEVKSEVYEVVEETTEEPKETEVPEEQIEEPQKRKRGRPKKVKDAPAPVEVLPKRKRGRPKKVKVASVEVAPVEILPKRKRGRPKKQFVETLEKKKRGRPSKFSIENLQKKERGRPRKYTIELLTKPELKVVPVLIKILEESSKPVHTINLLFDINQTCNTTFGSPSLRKIVNYIRAKSLAPIVCVNGNGYEISLKKSKIKEQIESLNKRASAIISSAHGLKKFL